MRRYISLRRCSMIKGCMKTAGSYTYPNSCSPPLTIAHCPSQSSAFAPLRHAHTSAQRTRHDTLKHTHTTPQHVTDKILNSSYNTATRQPNWEQKQVHTQSQYESDAVHTGTHTSAIHQSKPTKDHTHAHTSTRHNTETTTRTPHTNPQRKRTGQADVPYIVDAEKLSLKARQLKIEWTEKEKLQQSGTLINPFGKAHKPHNKLTPPNYDRTRRLKSGVNDWYSIQIDKKERVRWQRWKYERMKAWKERRILQEPVVRVHWCDISQDMFREQNVRYLDARDDARAVLERQREALDRQLAELETELPVATDDTEVSTCMHGETHEKHWQADMHTAVRMQDPSSHAQVAVHTETPAGRQGREDQLTTDTPTNTHTSTDTPTSTHTPTYTPTNTHTRTDTSTNTHTPTYTPTNTHTPTAYYQQGQQPNEWWLQGSWDDGYGIAKRLSLYTARETAKQLGSYAPGFVDASRNKQLEIGLARYNVQQQTMPMVRHPGSRRAVRNGGTDTVPLTMRLLTTEKYSPYRKAVVEQYKHQAINPRDMYSNDLVHSCIVLLTSTKGRMNDSTEKLVGKVWETLVDTAVGLRHRMSLYELAAVTTCASTAAHPCDTLLRECAVRINRIVYGNGRNDTYMTCCLDPLVGVSVPTPKHTASSLDGSMDDSERRERANATKPDPGVDYHRGIAGGAEADDDHHEGEAFEGIVDLLDRDSALLTMTAFARSGYNYREEYRYILRTLGDVLEGLVRTGTARNREQGLWECVHTDTRGVRPNPKAATDAITSMVDVISIMRTYHAMRISHTGLFNAIGELVSETLYDSKNILYQPSHAHRYAAKNNLVGMHGWLNDVPPVPAPVAMGPRTLPLPNHEFSVYYLDDMLRAVSMLRIDQFTLAQYDSPASSAPGHTHLNTHVDRGACALTRTLQDAVLPTVSYYIQLTGAPQRAHTHKIYSLSQSVGSHATPPSHTATDARWIAPILSVLHSLALLSVPTSEHVTVDEVSKDRDEYGGVGNGGGRVEVRVDRPTGEEEKGLREEKRVRAWQKVFAQTLAEVAPHIAQLMPRKLPLENKLRTHTLFQIIKHTQRNVYDDLLSTHRALHGVLDECRMGFSRISDDATMGNFQQSVTDIVRQMVQNFPDPTNAPDTDNEVPKQSHTRLKNNSALEVVVEFLDAQAGVDLDIALPALKIGFEVNGRTSHYVDDLTSAVAVYEYSTLLGKTCAKDYLLKSAGWHVCNISDQDWPKQWWVEENVPPEDRQTYLAAKQVFTDQLREFVAAHMQDKYKR
ncbi:hypothetical protein SARC_01013 [Sphaeroforma arctica JP610]|uniref:Uncharacterized protein n=1 Tax=Sphaeroforma arctica JP610 TaxID=667725 RepID=A0A0L0GCX0_9EUKA|nr:hypothetical protein SARC_01013 [Sphaeroforma arctica JP610]KNC86867.1 hypothetical protein SARC_01013 [Sphaeroforma arctica JP610]|eukprot:XP_014160769.1 hypothetical protein SARC_01013 [Sphaeroforma arctica JP610]